MTRATLLDLRYAMRSLRRTPAFAVTAILIVALSVASGAAVFALLNAVYLSALPYPMSSRTVVVRQVDQTAECRRGCALRLPRDAVRAVIRDLASQADIGIGHDTQASLATASATILSDGVVVSPQLVTLLGLTTSLGRSIAPHDTLGAVEPPIVLSREFWRDQFQSDSSIIGKSVRIDGHPHRVIGVLSADAGLGKPLFDPSEQTAPYLVPTSSPIAAVGEEIGFTMVARLHPGVTLDEFSTRARTALGREYADASSAGGKATVPRIEVVSLRDAFDAAFESVYPIFLGAVLLAIGVAAANLAALFLSRQAYRHREISLRAALGASAVDLMRPVWLEGLLVCAIGGLTGVACAELLVAGLGALPLKVMPYWTTFRIDWRVVVFSLFVSIGIAFIVGLVPAAVVRRGYGAGLSAVGTAGGQSTVVTRSGRTLVAFQVACAVILLSCGGLLLRTSWTASHVRTGVASRAVVFGAVDASPAAGAEAKTIGRQPSPAEVLATLRSAPGVASAAVAMSMRPTVRVLTVLGADAPIESAGSSVAVNMVSPDYFSALGTTLVAGQQLGSADAAILDDETARLLFGDKPAVGRRLKLGPASSSEPWRTVVGVAETQRLSVIGSPPSARRTVFIPLTSSEFSVLRFVVRRSDSPDLTARSVRRALHGLAPTLTVAEMRPVEQLIGSQLAPLRVNALVIGLFACVGLLLSAIGIYGIIASGVAHRRTDIAVRIALGARPWDIVRASVGEAVWVGGLGVLVGLALTVSGTRLVRAFLYGTNPLDPLAIAAAVCGTLAVAMIAAAVPAIRASRIDPVHSLRV